MNIIKITCLLCYPLFYFNHFNQNSCITTNPINPLFVYLNEIKSNLWDEDK